MAKNKSRLYVDPRVKTKNVKPFKYNKGYQSVSYTNSVTSQIKRMYVKENENLGPRTTTESDFTKKKD